MCQELLLGDLGLYCARVAQFATTHFIDGRKDEGSTYGVGDPIQVTIVDLRRSCYLQPSAHGGVGVGRYRIV